MLYRVDHETVDRNVLVLLSMFSFVIISCFFKHFGEVEVSQRLHDVVGSTASAKHPNDNNNNNNDEISQYFISALLTSPYNSARSNYGTPGALRCHSLNETKNIHGNFPIAGKTRPAVPSIPDSGRIKSLQYSMLCNGPPFRRRFQLRSIILQTHLTGHNEQGLR